MKNSKRDKSKADRSKSTKKLKSEKQKKQESKGEDQIPDFALGNQKSAVSKKLRKNSQSQSKSQIDQESKTSQKQETQVPDHKSSFKQDSSIDLQGQHDEEHKSNQQDQPNQADNILDDQEPQPQPQQEEVQQEEVQQEDVLGEESPALNEHQNAEQSPSQQSHVEEQSLHQEVQENLQDEDEMKKLEENIMDQYEPQISMKKSQQSEKKSSNSPTENQVKKSVESLKSQSVAELDSIHQQSEMLQQLEEEAEQMIEEPGASALINLDDEPDETAQYHQDEPAGTALIDLEEEDKQLQIDEPAGTALIDLDEDNVNEGENAQASFVNQQQQNIGEGQSDIQDSQNSGSPHQSSHHSKSKESMHQSQNSIKKKTTQKSQSQYEAQKSIQDSQKPPMHRVSTQKSQIQQQEAEQMASLRSQVESQNNRHLLAQKSLQSEKKSIQKRSTQRSNAEQFQNRRGSMRSGEDHQQSIKLGTMNSANDQKSIRQATLRSNNMPQIQESPEQQLTTNENEHQVVLKGDHHEDDQELELIDLHSVQDNKITNQLFDQPIEKSYTQMQHFKKESEIDNVDFNNQGEQRGKSQKIVKKKSTMKQSSIIDKQIRQITLQQKDASHKMSTASHHMPSQQSVKMTNKQKSSIITQPKEKSLSHHESIVQSIIKNEEAQYDIENQDQLRDSIQLSEETAKMFKKKGTKTSGKKSKKSYDLAYKKTFDEMKINQIDDVHKIDDMNIYNNLDDQEVEDIELEETGGNQMQQDFLNDFDDEDFGKDNQESVHALTLKDGVDYDDKRMNDITYPQGFNAEDDLNNDGIIDHIEHDLKIISIKDKIRNTVDEKIKEEYLQKFRKEVDFHHKVAYRFEKGYRLTKKQPSKKKALNMEIIEIISEHGDYIEQDPMALFYCLYFCIYYNNPDLVEFLRTLISKMIDRPQKIDQMLEFVDVNGIERLRTIGEVINSHVYHMVLYQAIDDDLRVVYSQILRQLRAIQLRDKDALQFLKQRDYNLIRLTFEKVTTKINVTHFFKKSFSIKAVRYRKYNQAYYEEILIDYHVEQRIAQNYREKFLTTLEGIYMVLQMYCQNDYINHFIKIDTDNITQDQMVALFMICLRNDSYKIGIQIYLRYISPTDITNKIIDIIISSFRDSIKFHEIKMFFLMEHMEQLSILQLNAVIDNFQTMFNRKDFMQNPMLAQYNTIKYALLCYRITWLIENKRIYSLITKCTLLNSYLLKGIYLYLERQTHIAQLYKFMREPVFHLTEKKDSLDVMMEMNMDFLLKHPVIVEVLNLVYEGRFSVDSSVMSLSQTFQSFFIMEATELKSINERLIYNIKSLGDQGTQKQASLQFNIWKQCIEQREQDEMIFSVIFGTSVLIVSFLIDLQISNLIIKMEDIYGKHFVNDNQVFMKSTPAQLTSFCQESIPMMLTLQVIINLFYQLTFIAGLGFFTALIQKITVLKLKDNVKLEFGQLIIETGIVITTVMLYMINIQKPESKIVSQKCFPEVSMTNLEQSNVDFIFLLLGDNKGGLNFKLVVSSQVVLYTLFVIIMLQRTQKLGELILMIGYMVDEFKKFIITFGLLIGLFIIVGMQLTKELKQKESTVFQIVLDIFDAFNGKQNFDDFTFPQGQTFIAIFVYIFNILLLSFLVAMFINKYKFVWKNLDALRRQNIIKLKNSSSYDSLFGSITITFFPYSIIVLPFIIPVVIFKSERLNDFILKIQYCLMIIMYCLLAIIIAIPMTPILYVKCMVNSTFILFNNKREEFNGQNIAQFSLALFSNPLVIIVSLAVDMISLPNLLMREEKCFESKYQQSLDTLNKNQFTVITRVFQTLFYQNFQSTYAGKQMTQIELMVMHRKIYSLIDNLHDLCCRGTKDYRESLANVQDYNMTKILSRKCSIPDISGDVKLSKVDFNVMYAIQMDIENYNYIDIILRDFNSGNLTQANLLKERKRLKEEEQSQTVVNNSQTKLNAGVVHMTMNQAPFGMIFQRDNLDVMNNFFISISSRAFTKIEDHLQSMMDNIEAQKSKETLFELDKVKHAWTGEILDQINQQYDRLDKAITVQRAEALITKAEKVTTSEDEFKYDDTDKNSKPFDKRKSTMFRKKKAKNKICKSNTQNIPKE